MKRNPFNGERIEELNQIAMDHFWPHNRQAGDMSEETGIKFIVNGKGIWVEDINGNQWIDAMSGLWLKAIGHGRKEIARAVSSQMNTIAFTPMGSVSPVTVDLAGRLASLSPDKDSRVFFVSGGSEAVETALKMAKNYHYNNGDLDRWKIISRRGSYHGGTYACVGLGGISIAGPPERFGPLVPGNIHVTQPNEFRCKHCENEGECNLECAIDIEKAIKAEGASNVAAFIGEPVSASAGIHIPHQDYWPTVREICTKYGVLLICDEIITGFGRTGKMFATEHWGITPDIFTVAKALTSGYIPIGATIASRKISDSFMQNEHSTFQNLFTFGGNPVSSAAALANLDILENENMIKNSKEMGDYLFNELQILYKHNIVGDVRGGFGLLCAIELVKDQKTKQWFDKAARLEYKLGLLKNKYRMLGRTGNIIPLAPPLCITKSEVDHLVSTLDHMITDLQEEL